MPEKLYRITVPAVANEGDNLFLMTFGGTRLTEHFLSTGYYEYLPDDANQVLLLGTKIIDRPSGCPMGNESLLLENKIAMTG